MDSDKPNYVKRTQKDYSISFKLQVVQEIEQGFLTRTQALDKYGIQARSTLRTWLKKYGNFDHDFHLEKTMSKTPEQRILELEQQVKLLEKQKARAEQSKAYKQELAKQVIELVQPIRTIMPKLGTRKLYDKLALQLYELSVGRDKLFDILQTNQILIKPKRKYLITTDSHHRFKKHENLIESLDYHKPEQVWVI